MEEKNIQIEKIILEQHQKNPNVSQKYIEIIKQNYINDPRTLEDIKMEIKLLFEKIADNENKKRQQENKTYVEKDSTKEPLDTIISTEQSTRISIIDNNLLTNYKQKTSTVDSNASVNYGTNETISSSVNKYQQNMSMNKELGSMFEQIPQESQISQGVSNAQSNSKAKTYVKSNGKQLITDNNGFSSFMNISFIITIISILGIFLATILILINK